MSMTDYNKLQKVITYNHPDALALLENQNCFFEIGNHEYNDFDRNITANLGDTIAIQTPSSATSVNNLVASFQPITQNIYHLPITGQISSAISLSNQQRIFNFEGDGKDVFFKAATQPMAKQIGAKIEVALAAHLTSSAIDNRDNIATSGQPQYLSGPTRFFNFISGGITSYQQLDQMQSDFQVLGGPEQEYSCVLPTNKYSPIVGSGLTQFALDRNNKLSQSWEVGEFGHPAVKYYKSNALPIQIAGSLGQASTTLTVVSTNDPTGANITQITFSGAGTSVSAIKAGDMGYFLSSSGLNATTFYGQIVTNQLVQFRAISDASSSGGNVTVSIICGSHTEGQGLCGQNGNVFQNMSGNIVAGMQAQFLPSHRAGLLLAGKAFYIAMPPLPTQVPFPGTIERDPKTKVATRMTYGSIFGQNQQGFIYDCIWGAVLLPRYCARICLPVT